MKLTTQLSINLEGKVNNKPIFYKKIKIGKISNSYVKDGKLLIDITINKTKAKLIKNLLQC